MRRDRSHQGTTLMTAICAFIAMLLGIQIWLVSAALEALLSHDRAVLIPAALASLGLFAINGGLLWTALRYDAGQRMAAS
ncbi:MAG: DUF6755 family protein [Byssovorax sp.]